MQIEQSNFREIVYALACIYRDPKNGVPNKSKIWPIPEVDRHVLEENLDWADKARKLLEANKLRHGRR